MSIQLAATRRALESVVHAALPHLNQQEVVELSDSYVDLAKQRVERSIPKGRRTTALKTGGFLVKS
jgi:hypothetical protein